MGAPETTKRLKIARASPNDNPVNDYFLHVKIAVLNVINGKIVFNND